MDSIENILGQFSDRMYHNKKADSQIFTPVNIAKDMLDALPNEVWNHKTTFIDICCKSGIFLYEILQRLMYCDDLKQKFNDERERREHILNNQLFGIAPDDGCKMFSTRTVYGSINKKSNIISFGNNYNTVMTNIDNRFLTEQLLKEFNTMKFDVVVGNPPYNNGMDLDFVDLGYKLSSKYVSMITPAKWQTAEADQRVASKNINYGQFREKYMPRMSHICFYPDCKDVFNIMQADGISWFVIEKNETSQCTVDNRLKANSIIDSKVTRDMKNSKTLFNIGEEIIDYLGSYNSFTFSNYKNGRFQVLTNNHAPGGALYAFSKTASKINIIGKSYIRDSQTGKLGYNEVNLPDDATLVFTSDNVDECVSFISWLNTKFVRFFVAINISKLAPMMCNECFKYVPAPEVNENYKYKFDHIYTDQELYEAFNLPQKYIDVIEAVIKERK